MGIELLTQSSILAPQNCSYQFPVSIICFATVIPVLRNPGGQATEDRDKFVRRSWLIADCRELSTPKLELGLGEALERYQVDIAEKCFLLAPDVLKGYFWDGKKQSLPGCACWSYLAESDRMHFDQLPNREQNAALKPICGSRQGRWQ